MVDQASEDQSKIEAYLQVIQDRILAPIQSTELRRYCTATLLLLFAAIDGVGKLLAPGNAAGSTERIRQFLAYMGGDYERCKKELLKLRHSLVHNAINVESYLSQTETGADQHLKKIGAAGFIYVDTMVMSHDFVAAFDKFRADIQQNIAMMKRAADRLEWKEDDPFSDPNVSPPPRAEFIYAG